MRTAYVLLSGGIDSTTCLHIANKTYERVVPLIADYGQRHRREIDAAVRISETIGLRCVVMPIHGIIPSTALTDGNENIPDTTYSEITGKSPAYVPFRNGLLISAAASYAAGDLARYGGDMPNALFFGAHAEDAHNFAYADCTPEFIGAMANAVHVGTYGALRLVTPLEWMTKANIIGYGDELGIDYSTTYSCYRGDRWHCGACPTCYARQDAFAKAGVKDPTWYAKSKS